MSHREDRRELVDELLTASRALVGIAVRSIAAAPVEVTVAQHRLLVLLAANGAQSVGDIADHLGVNPSNASRHADRLQKLDLVERLRSEDDGRVVRIAVTPAGRVVLDAVTQHRRAELADHAAHISRDHVAAVTAALRELNSAMDEVSDADWDRPRSELGSVPVAD